MRALTFLLVLPLLTSCASARRPGALAEMRFGAVAARHELWREAVVRFERVTGLRPRDARAWNDLAVAYEGAGRIRDAFEAYRKAVEYSGVDPQMRANFDRFLK